MDLTDPPRRPRAESIVPMINVVFLLLIIFLMTSQLSRPEPFEVSPPTATTDGEAEADPVLFLDKDGRLAFEDARGQGAIAALAALTPDNGLVQMRADGAVEAKTVARTLRDLAAAGLSRVELVVATP